MKTENVSILIDKLIYYCDLDLSKVSTFKELYDSIENHLYTLVCLHVERELIRSSNITCSEQMITHLLYKSKIELSRRIHKIQLTNIVLLPI